MENIVVTGATSMIGLAVVNLAIEQGRKVVAIVRPNSSRRKYLPESEHLTVVECDLESYSQLNLTPGHYDIFIHLAWEGTNVAIRDQLELQLRNIEYELNAVRLAKRIGCGKFIGIGSQAEYGHHKFGIPTKPNDAVSPESGYGIAKYTAYKMSKLVCQELDIEHCWIRVFSVYGENDQPQTLIMTCIDAFLNSKQLDLTKCEQLWDYIYVKDVADAILKVGEYGINDEVYCLGNGECKELKQYVETIRKIANPSIKPNYGKREYFKSQPMYLCADTHQLAEVTGFEPKYSFEEGIKQTIQWYQTRSQKDG